jgi:P4 family phage/plasmid primase-like protien
MTYAAFQTEKIDAIFRSATVPTAEPPSTSSSRRGRPRGAQNKKPKKENLPLTWTDRCIAQTEQPWRIELENELTSGAAVWRWNGIHFGAVGVEGGTALALKWIKSHDPDRFDPAVSEKCHRALVLTLRTEATHRLPTAANAMIPLNDTYLEIQSAGGIIARKPEPKYGMTYAIDVTTGMRAGQLYSPKSLPAGSKFRSFLERAQPNPEVRNLIQELCGATLLQNNYSVASWNHGAAGSGKSTLAELCLKMQRAGTTAQLSALADRFGLEGLLGSSFVYIDEVEAGEKVPEGKLKSLISQNTLPVERKGEKGVSTRIRAKYMFCSNSKPFIRDKSDGVWRRLCIIEWKFPIPAGIQEGDYHEVLWKEESQLILDWMIEGAVRLVKRGRFLPEAQWPEEVRLTKEYAREESDSIRAWVNANHVERVTERADWLPKSRIYAAYRHWCEAQETPALEANVFWRGLRPKLNLDNDYQRSVPGQGQRPHQGVRWSAHIDEMTIPMVSAASLPEPPIVISKAPWRAPTPSITVPVEEDDFTRGLWEKQA